MVVASQEYVDAVIEGIDSLLDNLGKAAEVDRGDGERLAEPAPDQPLLARGSGPQRRPQARSETVAFPLPKVANQREIKRYFEYSNHGIEVLEDGLREIPFGEFLVEQNALTRFELLRALQMQDQAPRRRLGECVAALGFLPVEAVSDYLRKWNGLDVVVVGPSAD